MSNNTIGKRITFYREAKKWSQEVFAEKLGLSLTYVGMLERGEKLPKLETFIKIANTLEVSADLLLADVLTTGYSIKSSEITKKLELLPADEREKIYDVVETMIKHTKK
jgi:transcriptional regulator with XRE-family HTH domain